MAAPRTQRKSSLNVTAASPAEPSASDSDVGSSEETLARIRSGRLGTRVPSEQIREVAETMAQKVGQAHGMSDEQTKSLAEKILNGKVTEVRANDEKDRKIYAELLADFNEECNKIGHGFDAFEELAPEEQALIGAAEAMKSAAEVALEHARNDWYFIPGNKARAVAKAETDLNTAKLGVTKATDQANIARTKRVLNADFSELFDRFEKRGARTEKQLIESRGETEKSYARAQVAKASAFKAKAAAAQEIKELEPQIEGTLAQLHQEESIRDTLEVGSKERTVSEQKVSDLRRRVEELNGFKNQALVLYQNKERAVLSLEVQEQTVLIELNAHEIAITNHQANREHWRNTFKARIEIMKAAAGIEAHQRSDDVGAAMTQKNAEFVSQTGVAVLDSIVGTFEKHTERRKQLADVKKIQRKGIEDMIERLREAHRQTMDLDGAEDGQSYPDASAGATGESDSGS